MKVIIEAQHVCEENPRGIAIYGIQLIRRLLDRRVNQYGLAFFDGNRERNNRKWMDKYFGEFAIPLHECNSLSYKQLAVDDDVYHEKSYNELTGASGDIFHFLHVITVPRLIYGKTIVTIHDLLPLRYPAYFIGYQHLNDSFPACAKRIRDIQPTIIADSESTKSDIIYFLGVSPDRIHVIPLAYDGDACFPQKDGSTIRALGINAPYVLYLGAIDARKNIIRIIDAFKAVVQRFPDIKLVLAGAPNINAKETLASIDSTPIRSNILLTGYVTDQQKRALYAGAIAFLFPSLFEGFGLPVLEAMACGCPVITSNVSSMPEVVGDAAVLVDPYRVEQLAWEMERLIQSETLRKELIQKGFAQCAKFSWDRTAEMTEEVYRKVYAE